MKIGLQIPDFSTPRGPERLGAELGAHRLQPGPVRVERPDAPPPPEGAGETDVMAAEVAGAYDGDGEGGLLAHGERAYAGRRARARGRDGGASRPRAVGESAA